MWHRLSNFANSQWFAFCQQIFFCVVVALFCFGLRLARFDQTICLRCHPFVFFFFVFCVNVSLFFFFFCLFFFFLFFFFRCLLFLFFFFFFFVFFFFFLLCFFFR